LRSCGPVLKERQAVAGYAPVETAHYSNKQKKALLGDAAAMKSHGNWIN
jgi:hypothetical protein